MQLSQPYIQSGTGIKAATHAVAASSLHSPTLESASEGSPTGSINSVSAELVFSRVQSALARDNLGATAVQPEGFFPSAVVPSVTAAGCGDAVNFRGESQGDGNGHGRHSNPQPKTHDVGCSGVSSSYGGKSSGGGGRDGGRSNSPWLRAHISTSSAANGRHIDGNRSSSSRKNGNSPGEKVMLVGGHKHTST